MHPHLSIIKRRLAIAVFCLFGILVLSIGKYLLSTHSDSDIPFVKLQPLIPIFAAVDTTNNSVSFVNEQDLGFKALNLSKRLPTIEVYRQPITPNETGNVILHQPDAKIAREVPLLSLDLSPLLIQDTLSSGKDWSRVNIRHKKVFITLPTGETAIWIQVHHFHSFRRYWNGLLYVVRNDKPVILATLQGASDFFIRDMDNDGFKDIVRVADSSVVKQAYVSTNLIQKAQWDWYSWDNELNTFLKGEEISDSFVKKYSFQSLLSFLKFSIPFLMVLLLGIFYKILWMRFIIIPYFVCNLLFVWLIGSMDNHGFSWAVLLIVFQYCCQSMGFKLSKLKYK